MSMQVGFIGLGAMGAPMARNLHLANYSLSVWNRSKQRSAAFADDGIPVADSPRQLAAGCDAIVIMVSDPAALEAVLHGDSGLLAGLRPETLVINMSTVSHAATITARDAIQARGGRFVDAPVSGTVKPAEDGTLVILAGADADDLASAQPLLDAMGKKTVLCGEVGQGTRMKLVINLMLGGMMELLAEGLSLGRRGRLDPELVLDAIANGPLGAPLYGMKGRMMLDGKFDKQFPIDLLFKDMNLVLEEAGLQQVPIHSGAAVRERLSEARAAGLGDLDMAALYKAMDR